MTAEMSPDRAPLELHNLEKTYGGVTALSGVDLAVEAGTFHCLVGPNGSGKTTLFQVVLGLTNATSGTVSRPADGIGCGFQRANFYRHLTVAENLSVFAALSGADDEEWQDRLVETLRLDRVLDRPAGDLSGGFAKKLDLALALLDRPSVVLLDEPLGDLDDVSKEILLEFLAAYRDEGNAILVSTHHLDDFEPYLDRLTVLYDGDVVLDAPADRIDTGQYGSLHELYLATVRARESGTA
ncbi:ATP-binding cassette domain-containing protein [Halorientalis litorea]|uniref:ATP-binding cassette domain-containing protein n=1 Tax=Halorientalis litorea TaxID=2931977 RepID=UPI001FF4F7B0|nr:ABC transporter ATP-binding protein [Halorientalis litorea]